MLEVTQIQGGWGTAGVAALFVLLLLSLQTQMADGKIPEYPPGIPFASIKSALHVSLTSGVFETLHFTPANGFPARQARGFDATFRTSSSSEKYFVLAATDDGYIKMALVRCHLSAGTAYIYVVHTKGYSDRSATLDTLTTAQVNNAYVRGFNYDYDVERMVSCSWCLIR